MDAVGSNCRIESFLMPRGRKSLDGGEDLTADIAVTGFACAGFGTGGGLRRCVDHGTVAYSREGLRLGKNFLTNAAAAACTPTGGGAGRRLPRI